MKIGWNRTLPASTKKTLISRGGDPYGSGFPKHLGLNLGLPMPLQYIEKDTYMIEFSDVYTQQPCDINYFLVLLEEILVLFSITATSSLLANFQ